MNDPMQADIGASPDAGATDTGAKNDAVTAALDKLQAALDETRAAYEAEEGQEPGEGATPAGESAAAPAPAPRKMNGALSKFLS